MLSIVPIKKSSIELGYYLKQDGNYYIEDVHEKKMYQWMGKGAERLGLISAIEEKDHANVYDGILPGNIVVGKRNQDGTLAGRPGYDLTFSMNKELSLIVCCTQDKSLRDYFLNAHINAVKTAMHEVEKMASARKSVNGLREYELTKNIVVSLCTHFSSRAGDPQVHTHALVANATERKDGQWRALSTDMQRKHGFYEKIRDHGTFLGHIYQNEMAIAAQAKGFDVTPVNKHGMFSIASFPEDIKKHFSKRRQQIVSIVDSLQHANKNDKILYNHVAQHSKAAKEKINYRDFMAKSKSSMQQFLNLYHTGQRFDDMMNKCFLQKVKDNVSPTRSNDAILDAVSALSRFSITLDANRIIEKAMQLDLGSSSISELQLSLNQLIQLGVLHKTDSGHFTSQHLIETEKRLIQKIDHSKHITNIDTPKKPTETVKEAIQQHRLCVIEEPKQLDAKLNMIDTLVNDLESNNKKVTILTQTKSLAFDHNEHDRSHLRGLWQQLKRLGKSDRAESLYGFLHRYEESTSNPIANMLTRKGKEVFLVDEGQHLSFDVVERLIDLTKERQANLIFLSNSSGKQSQFAGNVISLLKKADVPIIKSTSQKSMQTKSKSSIIIHEVKPNLNMSTREKQTHRQATLAKKIVNQYGERLKEIEVLSITKNSAVNQSNLIRESLKKHGLLDQLDKMILTEHRVYLTDEEQKHAKFFKKGWVAKTYVGRGQFVEKTIVGIDEKNNRLLVKSNFRIEKFISPQQLLKESDTKLIEKRHLPIANNDYLKLNTDNQFSKQLGLSTNTGYQIFIQDKKITLVPENTKLKIIKMGFKKLNGMDWSHNYVKTVHQLGKIKCSTKKVILDAPFYALNKNIISELDRQYKDIEIYTDDGKRAEKKIGMQVKSPLPSELILKPIGETDAHRAVDYGLSVLTSREAAFPFKKLIEKTLEYSLEMPKYEDILSVIDEKINDGDLYLRESFLGKFLATKETVALEKKIIDQIKSGKNDVTPFLKPVYVDQALSKTNLTDGQKDACRLLALSSDRFVMVQGYAGTGKSTMLKTLQSLLNQYMPNKESLIALAPTHKAVKELQDKGLNAQTLKRFLVEHTEKENKTLKNRLIILDESSMVSNTDFHALQSIVEKSKTTHCAYIGDIAQLLSVEGGKPSEIAYISKEADIATATMGEILRQKNPVLKSVTQHLIQGSFEHVEKAFNELNKNHSIILPKESDIENLLKSQDLSNLTDQDIKRNIRGAKIKLSVKKLADDYVKLSTSERENTLVAVATNKVKNKLNEAIRYYLAENGEISGHCLDVTILCDSRLTNEELHDSKHYKVGDSVKLYEDYYNVIDIFLKENTVKLSDTSGNERIYKLDWSINNELVGLYKKEKREIQAGDLLKWTKSDKDLGLVAHEKMRVIAVDLKNNSIQVLKNDGLKMHIDLKQPKFQHLDYQYVSTVHSLQGATQKRMMSLLISPNKKSNTLRLMYVVATRASEEAYFYVDDKEALTKQISDNKGDKTSALELIGLLETKSLGTQKNHTLTIDNKNHHTTRAYNIPSKTPRIAAKTVEDGLRLHVQTICEDLFGKPNASLSNAANWRYGRKGSLSITVAGQYQGSFCNFETGEKGGMIQLLMSELRVDFKTALEQGHRMLGGDLNVQQKPKQNHVSVVKKSIESTDKSAYVNSLVKRSVSIHGTLAEKYLINRSIKNTTCDDLRFIKRVSTGTGNKHIRPFSSALMAIARDKHGNLKTIQLTYLDPKTGARIKELKVEKRTLSSPKGTAVNLTPDVRTPKITFAAEGVETALSIKDAIPPTQKAHIQVLVSLGISNFPNITDVTSANSVVLVLDNDKDNQKQVASIKAAMTQMKQAGKGVVCIQPKLLNGQKTDYNDLAQAGHTAVIRKTIEQSIEQIRNLSKVEMSRNNNQPVKQNITKTIQGDRELLG